MERLRQALQAWVIANLPELLQKDLKIARMMGAPEPHTVSGYAYLLESQGKWYGRILRQIIDFLFLWLDDQIDHCYTNFVKERG